MPDYSALLQPLQVGSLVLRNRLISTAHVPRLAVDGMPGEAYRLYHAEKALGGIGLTIFGGSSSVAPDSPLAFNQLDASSDRVIPYFEEMAETIHGHGAALMVQITHMGRRGDWRTPNGLPFVAPSYSRELAHRSFAKAMEDFDFRRVRRAFAEAASRAQRGGLDGVELLAAAHQLIDSFLSPATNRRTDAYGGSLENRARFPLEVLADMRARVGTGFVVGLRMAGDEMQDGGMNARECLEAAQLFAESGLIDYLSIYQGTGDTIPELATMLPDMTVPSAAFLHLASAVRAHVDIPVFHASAIRDISTAARAIVDGHVDAVAMTRGHIADPHIVAKLRDGRPEDIRQCVGASYCIDFGGRSGMCIYNPATGRERTQPHVLPRADSRRRVVIAGGGPGGLEAARAALERGHEVVLFEAAAELGGQLNLASRVPQRERLAGIVRWLERQVRRGGGEIRLEHAASAEDVRNEAADVVFVATGGEPIAPEFEGSELCVSAWELISGRARPRERVLVYDETGLPAAMGCADLLSRASAEVELACADRMPGEETGATLHVAYCRNLFGNGVIVTPNMRLSGARTDGNQLVARLVNLYTGDETERRVDQIVYDVGTRPRTELYDDLRQHSRNLGELDHEALLDGARQRVETNPDGEFLLFRIGDALVARNVHAAIYDAARIVKTL